MLPLFSLEKKRVAIHVSALCYASLELWEEVGGLIHSLSGSP